MTTGDSPASETDSDSSSPQRERSGATSDTETGIDHTLRSTGERRRTFAHILANTAVANVTTSYLWFALTFWIYLQTRNVIATGIIGGAYMLLLAMTSISFGTFVDRFRKLVIMRFAGAFTLAAFALAGAIYLAAPAESFARMDRPWLWAFALVVLVGAVVENLRNIALSTTVTILIEPDRRANANGLVGTVQGVAFLVTSVLSGLSVGYLGMGWTQVVALVFTALAFVHLLTVTMPEERRPAHSDAHGSFDLVGSWRAVTAVSGLFALILFGTFNNFVGGVYMALMDPYGLEMFSVQTWGLVFALGATGFLAGGAFVARFGLGANPLRSLLVGVMFTGVLGAMFTIREWAWLYVLGIWLYMAVVPVIEAAEQTVVQRVVPLEKQGRVFGFSGAFEASAAPITAFLIAPLAEFWIIPFARTSEGAALLTPLLGTGSSRGIALIFLCAGVIVLIAASAAFFSPTYRRMKATYSTA